MACAIKNDLVDSFGRRRTGVAPRPLVLGLGNLLLRDDGVGVAVIEHLRTSPTVALDAEVVDGGTLSHTLLPLIEDSDPLIVVDACDLRCPAGTVRVFRKSAMDQYLGRRGARSVHEVGLSDLLDMARLRDSLPQRRALVAIQPRRVDWGSALSPEVEDAVPAAAREVHRLLEAWS